MAISEALGERRTVELAQGPIELRERGDGVPLLFVHGGLANGDLWRGVVPILAATGRFRCIVPDLPLGSHPAPMRPEADLSPPGQARIVVALIEALGLERVTIVANDAGGAISQLVAASWPERIDRLVLTSCDNHRGFPPRYLKPVRLLTAVAPLRHPIARAFGLPPIRTVFYRSVARRPIEPEILDSYLQPMLRSHAVRHDLIRFFRGVHPRQTVDAARALRAFPRPTLVVWGGSDLWFGRRGGRRLAATIPDARFVVLPRARTFVPEDAPQELAALVDEFADGAAA